MKNSIKFLTVLVVTGLTFTACDDIESLADIDFKSSLTDKYNIDFSGETEGAINESMTLDLADNSSVSKYLDKLKKVKITRITYKLTKYSGDKYVGMNVGFYMNGNTIVAPNKYDSDSDLGVEYEITDAAILQTISTTLLSSKKVTLQLKGEYKSETPGKGKNQSESAATAEITVTVYFEATANPL